MFRTSGTPNSLRRGAQLWCVAAAVIYTVVAVSDLVAHPASGKHLHGVGDFLFESLLIPYVGLTFAAVSRLRTTAVAPDSRSGRVGLRLATVGLIGFLAAGVTALATANSEALGPVYFLAEVLTVIGIALIGVGIATGAALPRWSGVVLGVGWLIGSPVGEHVAGAGLVAAAAFLSISAALGRAGDAARLPTGAPVARVGGATS